MKIPVAIKTIQDSSGRQTFTEITDVRIRAYRKKERNVLIFATMPVNIVKKVHSV